MRFFSSSRSRVACTAPAATSRSSRDCTSFKNRATVCVFREPDNCEKHRLFERAKDVSHAMPTL
jgi:hypothetical protein